MSLDCMTYSSVRIIATSYPCLWIVCKSDFRALGGGERNGGEIRERERREKRKEVQKNKSTIEKKSNKNKNKNKKNKKKIKNLSNRNMREQELSE